MLGSASKNGRPAAGRREDRRVAKSRQAIRQYRRMLGGGLDRFATRFRESWHSENGLREAEKHHAGRLPTHQAPGQRSTGRGQEPPQTPD